MSEEKTYDVPENIAESAHINAKRYREMYQRSINDSDAFWGEQAEEFLSWSSKWDKVQDWDYNEANINWFVGGKLNVSYNCSGQTSRVTRRSSRHHLGRRRS